MSDISLGSGALVVGGGMFFVVTSIAFFTRTEVGLEGFDGLQQIGADAFTSVITALALALAWGARPSRRRTRRRA